ncbi:MAG: type IV secretory system conjugative DNA transfer family protein [Defluviitaleaceae bacterium]|nr:type IV secretory system conjugative DNA transfer family protein [Defluviitaleaceae bacterium]
MMDNRGGGFPVWLILQWVVMILPRTIGHAIKHGWIHIFWGFILLVVFSSIMGTFGTVLGLLSLICSIAMFIRKMRINSQTKRDIAAYWHEQRDPSAPEAMKTPKYGEVTYNTRTLGLKRTHSHYFPSDLSPRTAPRGFFFGEKDGDYIMRAENPDSSKGEKEGHILIVGGSGSGKSSCIAIPTLRLWQSPVLVVDIKGELYEKSHRTRRQWGNKQIVLDPKARSHYGYEPFIFIRVSSNPYAEAKDLSEILIPIPPQTLDPNWLEGARSILRACIFHFYEDYTFLEMVEKLSFMTSKTVIKMLFDSDRPHVKQLISRFVELSEKQLGGYYEPFGKALEPFGHDENIKYILSREDNVSPNDLEKGHDIFIIPPDLSAFHPILNLIISQFLINFKNRIVNNSTKHILFMLDEFANIGKMPRIAEAMATVRSQKVTICSIIQDLGQLDEIYGKNVRSSIISNCAYIAILRVNDAEAQAYFSNMIGTYERIKITKTEGYIINTAIRNSETIQMSEEEKHREKRHQLAFIEYIVLITPHKEAIRIRRKPYYAQDRDDTYITDLFTFPVDEYKKL